MIKVQYLLVEKKNKNIFFRYEDVKEHTFKDLDEYFNAVKFAFNSDLIFIPLTINYI